MDYEFDSEIKVLEGKMKWRVVYFPYSAKEAFDTGGRVPVQITVDGHAFEHTLLPSRNGHYWVYNELIRRAVKKETGDSLHVVLRRCEEARTVIVPDYIARKLTEGGILDRFLNQPDYIKREQIQHIEVAKKEETRQNRLLALLDKLKD